MRALKRTLGSSWVNPLDIHTQRADHRCVETGTAPSSSIQPGPAKALLAAWHTRPRRVLTLAGAIIAMSLVDLYLTILFLTHTGMSEANPLARAMIEYQSPFVLSVWKLITVTVCVGILVLIRNRRSAEIGAWASAIVLGLLMAHWVSYIDFTEQFDNRYQSIGSSMDDEWVFISTDQTLLID